MQFWDDIGKFLATFEPKDLVTVLLALGAIGISVWTASQTWRYHPKPTLIAHGKAFGHNSVPPVDWAKQTGPSVYFEILNRGNGTAYDVSVQTSAPTLAAMSERSHGIIEPGASVKTGSSLRNSFPETRENPVPGGQAITVRVYPTEPVDPGTVKVLIRWRQSPNMRRLRRQRVRFE